MSYLNQPAKFTEAFKRLKAKKEIASRLSSKQWQEVPAAIKDRAFFSSRVASARFLTKAKKLMQAFMLKQIEDVISPDGVKEKAIKIGGRADFVDRLKDFVLNEGLGEALPPGTPRGQRGVIPEMKDLASSRRLGLIFETNIRSAYGYGNFQASTDPDVSNVYPAWRFVRGGYVKEPRPLHKKYENTVRRKDDTKFWLEMNKKEIGGLGVPHGPWGFNSQMTVQEVDRGEAMRLGLIKKDEKIKEPRAEFNKALSVDLSRMDKGVVARLKKAFGKSIRTKGKTLSWTK